MKPEVFNSTPGYKISNAQMRWAIWFSVGQLSFQLGLYLSVLPLLANKPALLLFGTVSCFNSFLQARQEPRAQRPPLTELEMTMKSENEFTNCHILFLINQVNVIRATRTGKPSHRTTHIYPKTRSILCPSISPNPAPAKSNWIHKTGRTWPKLAHREQINK